MDFLRRPPTPRRWTFHPYGTVLSMALAGLCLTAFGLPGESGFSFTPLLYLPVIVAILTWRFEYAILLGIALSIALTLREYHYLLPAYAAASAHPNTNAMVRASLMNLVTILGALWARKMQDRQQSVARQLKEADTLLKVALWLDTSSHFDDAVAILLSGLSQIHPYDIAALFQYDERQSRLLLEATQGEAAYRQNAPASYEASSFDFLDGDTTATYIADTQHQVQPSFLALLPDARALLVVPMALDAGPPRGLLALGFAQPNALTPEERRRIVDTARCLAFSLQRIRLQERLEGMAFTDPMTQLPNLRAFQQHLTEETRRAIRYQRPLALIMLDLDNFKSVNDRFGHPVGDRLLIHLSAVIRASMRATDIPARYGGEEFAILCPETEKEEAGIVAERVRHAIEQSSFAATETDTLTITVSCGVATTPDDAETETELLAQADAALYRAKNGGKNQVAFAAQSVRQGV